MKENQAKNFISDGVQEFDREENLTDEESRELKQFNDILEDCNRILLQKCEEAWGDTLSLEQKNHMINSLLLKQDQHLEEILSGTHRFPYVDLGSLFSSDEESQISSEASLNNSKGDFITITIEFSIQERDGQLELTFEELRYPQNFDAKE